MLHFKNQSELDKFNLSMELIFNLEHQPILLADYNNEFYPDDTVLKPIRDMEDYQYWINRRNGKTGYKTNSVRLKELVASGNHNMVGLSNPCYKRIKSPCNKCGVLMYSNNIKRHQNGTKCFSNGG